MTTNYQNPGKIEFDGLIKAADGGGAYVEFPYSAEKLFGVKGRVPANFTFDGAPYRGSLAKMSADCHLCPILKNIRERIGKQPGDSVHVTIELDDAPRTVELAPDVEAAFAQAGVLEPYRALAFTHQREYARWIEEAKRPETRTSRIQKSVDMIRTKSAR